MTTEFLSPLVYRSEAPSYVLGLPAIISGMDAADLSGGRSVAILAHDGADGDGQGLRGVLFDGAGAIEGTPFAINQFTAGAQQNPQVAALQDGGFVVGWSSDGQDGFGLGGYVRLFDADGTPRGDAFQVTPDLPESQALQGLAALPDGGFVALWATVADGVETFTFRAFDAAGAPAGDSLAMPRRYSDFLFQFADLLVDSDGALRAFIEKRGGGSDAGLHEYRFADPAVAAETGRLVAAYSDVRGGFPQAEFFPQQDGSVLYTYRGPRPNMFPPDNTDAGRFDWAPDEPGAAFYSGAFRITNTDVQHLFPGFVTLADGRMIMIFGASNLFYGDELLPGGGNGVLGTHVFEWNSRPEGELAVTGRVEVGSTVTVDASGLSDADGIDALSYRWFVDGRVPANGTEPTLALTETMLGATLGVEVSWVDGNGSREVAWLTSVGTVTAPVFEQTGGAGADFLRGTGLADILRGLGGDDTLLGEVGSDTLHGGDGADTLNGGDGDDLIFGGETEADLRDVVYAGAGNDTVDAGWGNDIAHGGDGDDVLSGGFGTDTLIGNDGADTLSGGTGSDELHGGPGDDFLSGGWGFDRLNGGAGADRFLHLGIADHGSDWVQDYARAEGDVLLFGIPTARAADFQVNVAGTPGAGTAGVDEAFVIYRPTGQILWALVDGAALPAITVQVNDNGANQQFDLLLPG